MNVEKLYTLAIEDLPIKDIHPLHKAMIEECCERVLENPSNLKDKDMLINAVRIAFITCNSVLKGTLRGSLNEFDANQITLNYRNQTFILAEDSPFLKDE